MKAIGPCSVGALLLGALVTGCYSEPKQPAVQSHAVAVAQHDDARGVTSPQPTTQAGAPQAQPNAPAGNEYVTSLPPGGLPSTVPPQGLPEAQPLDDRAHASQIVTDATQQIERLNRVLSMSAEDSRHVSIQAAVGQLQSIRERVLKDIQSLDAAGASSTDDSQHVLLNRDVSDLQSALRDSYKYAPPSSQ